MYLINLILNSRKNDQKDYAEKETRAKTEI